MDQYATRNGQFVVEMKSIYAGLVMVEAKCIDIDARQTEAAQERDPANQTHLMNEQWAGSDTLA